MEKFVGYFRTSTGKQVLGLEEQKPRIQQFIQTSGDELIDIVSENESVESLENISVLFCF